MSTFAVFGMTRARALAEARKNVKSTRKTPQGEQQIAMSEWVALCEKRADEIMRSNIVRQLSPMFDAPQFCDEFIAVARKTLPCRDMHIKCKSMITDAKGRPVLNKKTGAPKVGWAAHGPQPGRVAA